MRDRPEELQQEVASVENANALQTAAALEVMHLTGGYASALVLRDVSLRVEAGKITALLGANGAGKSTLLRMAAGLLRPMAGAILVDGADVTSESSYHRTRRGMCLVPEARGVYKSLSVLDNLRMQADRSTDQTNIIEVATSAFPVLGERLSQRAETLSGGERQMLAMAVAYVRRPSLLLVDEASLGLAPVVVDAIFEFLKRVSDNGASLLVVDQYVPRALAIADFAYILRKGQIVYAGGPDDISDSEVLEHYVGGPETGDDKPTGDS